MGAAKHSSILRRLILKEQSQHKDVAIDVASASHLSLLNRSYDARIRLKMIVGCAGDVLCYKAEPYPYVLIRTHNNTETVAIVFISSICCCSIQQAHKSQRERKRKNK